MHIIMLEGQQSQRLLELQQEKAQQAAGSNAQAKKDLETHLHEEEQQLFDKHLELKDALSPPRQQGWFTHSVPAQPDIRDEMTKLQKRTIRGTTESEGTDISNRGVGRETE